MTPEVQFMICLSHRLIVQGLRDAYKKGPLGEKARQWIQSDDTYENVRAFSDTLFWVPFEEAACNVNKDPDWVRRILKESKSGNEAVMRFSPKSHHFKKKVKEKDPKQVFSRWRDEVRYKFAKNCPELVEQYIRSNAAPGFIKNRMSKYMEKVKNHVQGTIEEGSGLGEERECVAQESR